MNVVFGRHPVAEAVKAGLQITKILIADTTRRSPGIDDLSRLAASAGIPVMIQSRRKLDEISEGGNHQGVVAVVPDFSYVSRDLLATVQGPCRLVLLDGITDPANLGSIIRSAEAFGWRGVMIPSHRSVEVTPAVLKVAAGAAARVPVAKVGSAAEMVAWLTKRRIWVAGLDSRGGEPYETFSFPDRVCLVVGAEGRGLSRLVRERCDALIQIPMLGSLASLNAAVATAIVMAKEAEMRRQR